MLKQPLNLVYRVVHGRYFVTVPERRHVVVLNRAAFRILELCHGRTLASSRAALAQQEPAVDTRGLGKFVRTLEAHGLLTRSMSRRSRTALEHKPDTERNP